MISFSSHAQTRVGYSNGTTSTENVMRSGTGEHQGMAIRLSHEKLQMLKGHKITGVSAAYGSRNTTGNVARVFIATSLEGEALTESTVTITRAGRAWTDATLEKPYTITGDEEQLFVGTDMEISTSYNPLTADFTADNDNTCFVLTNDKWTDTKGTGFGSVNVRAIMDEDIDMTDLLVKSFQLEGYYKAQTPYSFSTEIMNFGTKIIDSFDVEVSIGDAAPVKTTYTDQAMAPGATKQISMPSYEALSDGDGIVCIKITNINGGNDDDMSDNMQQTGIFFYPQDMERAYLVEEFTSQRCVNCPNGQQTLTAALNARPEKFVKVLHHSGYQPDAFSMKIDYDYTAFYGSGGTFAPAMMINRTTCPGASSVPVMNVGTSLVNTAMNYVSNQHPYASLQLATEYDKNTRELKIAFSMVCHKDMPAGINVMNILLTQDGIVANQLGGSDDYVHHNACRGSILNNAFGGVLENGIRAGEIFTWEKTITLPESIYSDYWEGRTQPSYDVDLPVVDKNMRLVAYIAHYDQNDINKHNVYNVVEAKLGETVTQKSFATSIEDVNINSNSNTNSNVNANYNIAGQRVGKDYKGLVIKNGKKYLLK